MVHHTNQDKLNMVLVYGECHQNASEAVRCYRARFTDRPTPDRKSFVALCTNLATYGSFKKGKVSRRKRVTTDENVALVLQTVENSPQTSLEKLKDETNITVSSCRRILKGNSFFSIQDSFSASSTTRRFPAQIKLFGTFSYSFGRKFRFIKPNYVE